MPPITQRTTSYWMTWISKRDYCPRGKYLFCIKLANRIANSSMVKYIYKLAL